MNLALFRGTTIFTAVFFFKDSSYKATWILAERRAHDCRSLLRSIPDFLEEVLEHSRRDPNPSRGI
jgi:hypothetical protein